MSSTLELYRKLSIGNFVSDIILVEGLKEEFDYFDTQRSIRFQSVRDTLEEYQGKNITTIGAHRGEGPFVSRRNRT